MTLKVWYWPDPRGKGDPGKAVAAPSIKEAAAALQVRVSDLKNYGGRIGPAQPGYLEAMASPGRVGEVSS